MDLRSSAVSNRVSARCQLTAGLAVALLGVSGMANAGELFEAIEKGTTSLDLRLRYESVEQDNALDDADAVTVRARLGYTTQDWNAVTAFVEMENTSALVDDYAPAQPGYSVVADPEGAEVNQYGVSYAGLAGTRITLGRSRLILDNARWVGNVGWRQNEQTYDGVFVTATPNPALSLNYAYIGNVNTITATNVDVDGHLLNAALKVMPGLTLGAYAYLLDYQSDTATDFDTFGLRADGSTAVAQTVKLLYAFEYARQDAESTAADFSADYLLGEIGLGFKPVTLKFGYEVLGSDDAAFGLQTPLATKHAFNGWADVFLATPPEGLQDLYLSVSGNVGPAKLTTVYHQFSADESTSSRDEYGNELDLVAAMPIVGKIKGLLKYASYSAKDFGVDTDKLWLQFDYKF